MGEIRRLAFLGAILLTVALLKGPFMLGCFWGGILCLFLACRRGGGVEPIGLPKGRWGFFVIPVSLAAGIGFCVVSDLWRTWIAIAMIWIWSVILPQTLRSFPTDPRPAA